MEKKEEKLEKILAILEKIIVTIHGLSRWRSILHSTLIL
jgi:hypothetical protein